MFWKKENKYAILNENKTDTQEEESNGTYVSICTGIGYSSDSGIY